jgi:hypothetical protein
VDQEAAATLDPTTPEEILAGLDKPEATAPRCWWWRYLHNKMFPDHKHEETGED